MKRISLNMQKNDERINIVIMYAILLSMLVSFRDLAGLAISKSMGLHFFPRGWIFLHGE